MNSSCISSNAIDLRNSSSLWQFVYLPNEWILLNIVWPSIALLGVTGNITFIWTVLKVSVLRTSTFIILAALACSDTVSLIGRLTYSLCNSLTSPLRYGDGRHNVAIFGEMVAWFCFSMSLWLITLVSTERFLAVCHPIKHRVLKGTKGMIAIIVIIIVGSICLPSLGIPYSFNFAEYCIWWPSTAQFRLYPRVANLARVHYLMEYVDLYFLIGDIIIFTGTVSLFLVNCCMYTEIIKTLTVRKQNRALQTSREYERNICQACFMVIANGVVFFICVSVFALQLGFLMYIRVLFSRI